MLGTLREHIKSRVAGCVGVRGIGAIVGCGMLALFGTTASPPRWQLDGNPGPPSTAQINAAANQVKQRQAALGNAQSRLAASGARLTALQNQSEALTEQYDQTMVNEQRAAAAYQVTQSRLVAAQDAESVSREQVGMLAAQEFESGGGINKVTAMLGDAHGPQAYLNAVGMGQILAQYGTDELAETKADNAVASVFRNQARNLWLAKQADLQAAYDLRQAIEAEVARQQALVGTNKAARSKAASQLAAAQSQQAALQAAQAAAEARAAAARARAAAQAGGSPEGSTQAPSWAWGSGASQDQGDIAANWALSQLGKPYQWGAAGPSTYDCSGLSMVAWARAGVQLAHWTGFQWQSGPHVPLSDLRRGDLLFFATDTADSATIHHVGIYIGHSQMVDAPYTGAFVRIDSMYQPGGLIGAVGPAGCTGRPRAG